MTLELIRVPTVVLEARVEVEGFSGEGVGLGLVRRRHRADDMSGRHGGTEGTEVARRKTNFGRETKELTSIDAQCTIVANVR